MRYYDHKTIAITGACGTVGSQLVEQLVNKHNPKLIYCLDNNETELFFMEQKYADNESTIFRLADIRDQNKLEKIFCNVDIVFHTAAYKHVILCERSPFEAVQTNINGVKNVIEASRKCQVEKVIFTSSDKAVNPTNVMGTSKLMGERILTAANSNGQNGTTIFASTRFGNVLGSRGSVIPIFKKQIEKGGPVTLTDERMTRFIMSIEDAANLVIESAVLAKGGEVFVTKMPVIRIKDLAIAMIEELAPVYGHDPKGISIVNIGAKPGEKLYEELMSEEETTRTIELKKYFSIIPAFRSIYHDISYLYEGIISNNVDKAYNSTNESPMDIEELKLFLKTNDLLDVGRPAEHPDQRYWP